MRRASPAARRHSASAASSSHERAASRRGASADAAAGAGAGAGAGAPAPVHSQSAAAKAGAAQKSFSPRGVAHTDASVDGASGTHRRQRTHRWTGLTSDGHGRSIGGTTAYDQPSAVTALGSSRQPSAAKPSCTDLPPLQQERWHQRAGSVGYSWPGKVEPQPTKGSHRWSSHTSPSSRIHGASGASASSVRTRRPTASATRASSTMRRRRVGGRQVGEREQQRAVALDRVRDAHAADQGLVEGRHGAWTVMIGTAARR